MFPFDLFNVQRFPFTDFNKLNLDWICDILSKIAGGGKGQYIKKKSDADFDFEWSNTPSAGVSSVNGKTGAVSITPASIGAGTYTKPAGGIPYSDLSLGVKNSLDKASTCNIKFFNSVEDLGLIVGSATIADAVAALLTLNNAELICYATMFAASEYPFPVGNVRIWCTSNARPVIEFWSRAESVGQYVMYTDSYNVPTGIWVPTNIRYKDVSVTLSSSGSVSPFTHDGTVNASIGTGRHALSAMVIDSALTNPVICNVTDVGFVTVYGSAAATLTVRVLYI